MIRASFVPPRAIRELRDLTRRRKQLLSDATSERNRVQKTSEDANVKLGSVLSDVFGVSGQRMLEALLEGRSSPQELAEMARHKARQKIPEIVKSLAGNRFSEHHRLMIRMSLEHLRMLERQIIAIDEEVIQRIQSLGLERMLNLVAAIPGFGTRFGGGDISRSRTGDEAVSYREAIEFLGGSVSRQQEERRQEL